MDCSSLDFSLRGILQARIRSGLPFPPTGDLPNPGIAPASLKSPVLAGGFFTPSASWEAQANCSGAFVASSVILLVDTQL